MIANHWMRYDFRVVKRIGGNRNGRVTSVSTGTTLSSLSKEKGIRAAIVGIATHLEISIRILQHPGKYLLAASRHLLRCQAHRNLLVSFRRIQHRV